MAQNCLWSSQIAVKRSSLDNGNYTDGNTKNRKALMSEYQHGNKDKIRSVRKTCYMLQ